MKVSFNWLKQYIPIEVDLAELIEILTNTGLEVASAEKVERYPGGLEGLVIGEVTAVSKHPNADRLQIAKVKVGNGEEKSIVCGAPNIARGKKVVVALPGTTIHPIKGDPFRIKKGKIREEVSEGMICAEDEIGLGDSHDGIMVLEKKAVTGSKLRDHLKLQEDYVIEIDLTPNRTDAISHFGIARDYLAVKNLQPGFENLRIQIPDVSNFVNDNKNLEISVQIDDRSACPRYSGISMTGLKVGPSPDWLREKLLVIGLNPINNVVDAANYVMYETGQPMHTFDAAAITSRKVVIHKPEKGTKFTTLDGTSRTLSGEDLIICDQKIPMCIAGVFGGISSGVTENTERIFIESAYFSPEGIRKTARHHGLSTDASYRYERGVNPDGTIYALKRLALLLKELTGGEISSEIVDEYPMKIEPVEAELRWSYLNQMIGKVILKDEVRNILGSLDINIMTEDNASMKLRIPGYRAEVTREIDVVEEVLRIYGYNNIDIPERMTSSFSHREEIDRVKIRNAISDHLASNGFIEIMNNSLTAATASNDLVVIRNPLSNELNSLRKNLFHDGLKTIAFNRNRGIGDIRFFEFGKVYQLKGKDEYSEGMNLCIWLCGNHISETWREPQRKAVYFDIREHIDHIFSRMGILGTDLKIRSFEGTDLSFGQEFELEGRFLGRIGKVSEKLTSKFEVSEDVFIAELNWENLLNTVRNKRTNYIPMPKYPSIRRDLALLIEEHIEYATIEGIAWKTEGKILKAVSLFDVYQGKGIEKGKKSYAVSYVFQDPDKTLTDKQVDKIMEQMIKRYQKEIGASLR